MERNFDEVTPAPWRWKFIGNAGNYFLVGNDGEGPITYTGPDTADGKLKQAAPDLLAACEEAFAVLCSIDPEDLPEEIDGSLFDMLRIAIAKARGE